MHDYRESLTVTMRQLSVLLSLLLLLLSAGIIAGQSEPGSGPTPTPTSIPPSFEFQQAIGLPLPRSVLYEPNFERYAVVDAYGALSFVDARSYQTQHVLYTRGDYTDFAFSRSGRWFALTVGTRIELWDTQNYTIVSQLTDLSQALRVHGPLTFSPDDNLLLFRGTYPAPQSLRQSEFDTQEIPWIWNLSSARNEGPSTFPAGVEAYPFFDYRNGFVLGPENRIVAALPGRLHIIDAYSLDVLFDIETFRYEQDPLIVVFSARDNNIYVRPLDANALLQVDTRRGLLVEIPFGTLITAADLELLGGIELGTAAQVIGEPASSEDIDLVRLFLGRYYRDGSNFGRTPLTLTLIDLVVPPTGDGDRVQALLFLFNESTQQGQFFTSRPSGLQQMALSPDGRSLLVREGDEGVRIFDIASGQRILSVTPALRGVSFFQWQDKNRVLSYSADGTQFISDFERFDTASGESLAQDLRYSRRFDQFFWSPDSRSLVTLSGNEWRLFDVQTGEVLRREALPLRGSIVQISPDGYRYLTSTDSGRAVYDVNTGDLREVNFRELPARPIESVYASPDWEHFLVVYSANSWGGYYPGNEIAMYSLDDGLLWFAAGDDLAYAEDRFYGWVDNQTVFVSGARYDQDQPQRVYGLDYAPNGVSRCLAEASSEDPQTLALAWERLTRYMSYNALTNLTQLICNQVAAGFASLDVLQPTPTLPYMTPTAVVLPGVPACLTIENPAQADTLAAVWANITAGLSPEQIAQAEALLCEGIGPTATPRPDFTPRPPQPAQESSYAAQTIFFNVATGERASGSYVPPRSSAAPRDLIANEFRRTMGRDPGLIVLSPDGQLAAVSALPGELLIYRMLVAYDGLLANVTATAIAQAATAQLIGVLPSPTATYNAVGTLRPTLTPTITPTSPPFPNERTTLPEDGTRDAFCPSETLYTLENAPADFAPSGRILTAFGTEDYFWVVEPENGQRFRDENIPLCNTQLTCVFSWDGRWVLVLDYDSIYLARPDGSDQRVLFDAADVWPYDIYWWGSDLLIYEFEVRLENGSSETRIIRDYLDRADDPPYWVPYVEINGEQAEIVSTAYGEGYVVVRTTFSTGLGPGYRYYTYNIDTGALGYFGRLANYPPYDLEMSWVREEAVVRLFYEYPPFYDTTFVFDPRDGSHLRVGETRYSGALSPNRRYRAFSTSYGVESFRRSQPVSVWDNRTGRLRTYCLPETGARLYEEGVFVWSPDSRYLALQAFLPRDEAQEGVGQHTLILDTETGVVVDLTTGVGPLLTWTED
ncbi:MAG: WD40 repeat domain-containing protein [Chloroflexi bacterium]|nr:WD40 repeat domain-containing protein [Chloroflexota bacterium]